jgi:S1-C subfamily serine protease
MSNVLVELSNAMVAATEKAGASTVLVNARRRMSASGVVYAADLILTADHVVEQEEGITVTLSDGSVLGAKLAGRDPGSDLALLRLERPAGKPAEIAPEPKIGQLVLALGRPSDDYPSPFGGLRRVRCHVVAGGTYGSSPKGMLRDVVGAPCVG